MLLGAVMVPHPPMILPEVGRGSEKSIEKTSKAYEKAALFLAELDPDTVVVSTPHSVLYSDYFHVSGGKEAAGSMAQFGAPQVRIEKEYDTDVVETFTRLAREQKLPAGTMGERDRSLDHATLIPLYFLEKAYRKLGREPRYRLVRLGLSGLPLSTHYEVGMCMRKALDDLGRRAVWVGSGDLSHKLKESGPYGFDPHGPEYDERIMDVMGRAAFEELFDFSEAFCDAAAECGHRSFVLMAGALDRTAVEVHRLSHEDITGVGYGVCTYRTLGEDMSRNFLDQYREKQHRQLEEKRLRQDPYVRLARQSVEHYVRSGEIMKVPQDLLPELMQRRAGVFVSLHKDGALRGCIGTISPVRRSLAEEIIHNAVSACSEDPRFSPVEPSELDSLEYSVDVLGEAESVSSEKELDARKYGVIVTHGSRRGLLLPDLEGVETPAQQIAIARRKAGISPEEPVRLERFEVVRHF